MNTSPNSWQSMSAAQKDKKWNMMDPVPLAADKVLGISHI